MNDLIVHINEPYWGAYVKYGWDYKVPGIGLSQKAILDAHYEDRDVLVQVGKDKTIYKISPVTALNLAKKYKSLMDVRYGNKVVVIPQNRFEKYAD